MGNDSASGASRTTRRRLLAGGATVALGGLAGCLGGRDGPVPSPTVTSDRIDYWRLTDDSQETAFEESYGPVSARALERTRTYEYAPVADALDEVVDASASPVTFFATRIDLRPAVDQLPGEVGRDRLMSRVETAATDVFRAQLRDRGVGDARIADEGTSTVRSGNTATVWRLTGTYALDGEVPLSGGSTANVDGLVDMGARLGVWHDGTDALVAGGAYPTEPLIEVIDEALPDAVDAETIVTELADAETAAALATDPASFDEDVSQLLISVA